MAKLFFVTVLAASISGAGIAAEDFYAGTIKYYDNLKTCTPYTFSYPHPLVPGFTGQNVIKGKKGDKCQVTMLMPGNLKMQCEFSAATIKLMTSEAKYKEAREHQMSGSTSDPASEKMNEECKVN
jgi:hypothetical protein